MAMWNPQLEVSDITNDSNLSETIDDRENIPVVATTNSESAGKITEQPLARAPLRATLEENERLRREVFDASSKTETLRYKVMELTKMQDKSVQQILDEYYALKENNYQLNARLSQLEDIERRSEENVEYMRRQLNTCRREKEAAENEMQALQVRIDDLVQELDSARHRPPYTLDDLKGDDTDWTLRSDTDNDQTARGDPDMTKTADSTCTRAARDVVQLEVQISSLKSELSNMRAQERYNVESYQQMRSDNERLVQQVEQLQHQLENNERQIIEATCNVSMSDSYGAEKEDEMAKLKEELEMTKREKDTTKTLLVDILKKYGELKKSTEMSINISKCSRDELMGEVKNVHSRLVELREANRHLREMCNTLRDLPPDEESVLTGGEGANRNTDKTKRKYSANQYEKMAIEEENSVSNLERETEELMKQIRMKGMIDESIFALLGQSDESKLLNMNETSAEPKAVLQRSMLNTSIQGMLNLSHNASINVAQFKEKMTMCRELVQQMFDRLKGSAALFEEIQIRLGGESDELVEKLKTMQLNWKDISSKKKEVFDAITETETSVAELQLHLSLVEQTFNYDGSLLHDGTHENFERLMARMSTVGAGDVSLLEKLSMTRANGKDTQVLIETKEKLEQMTTELIEAYASRDIAQETVDKLRATISKMEEDTEEAREMMSNLQASEKKLLAENQIVMKRNEDCLLAIEEINQQLEESKAEVRRLQEAVDAADRKIDDMEIQLMEAEKKTEEIAVIEHEIMHLKNEFDRQLEEKTKFQQQLEEAKTTADGLCLEMQQVIREKDSVTERLEQEKESKRLMNKQLKEAREQIEENARRMAEWISEGDKTQHVTTEKLATFDNRPSDYEISMLRRGREFAARSSQTEVTSRDAEDELCNMKILFDRTRQIYINVLKGLEKLAATHVLEETDFNNENELERAGTHLMEILNHNYDKMTNEMKKINKEMMEMVQENVARKEVTEVDKSKSVTQVQAQALNVFYEQFKELIDKIDPKITAGIRISSTKLMENLVQITDNIVQTIKVMEQKGMMPGEINQIALIRCRQLRTHIIRLIKVDKENVPLEEQVKSQQAEIRRLKQELGSRTTNACKLPQDLSSKIHEEVQAIGNVMTTASNVVKK